MTDERKKKHKALAQRQRVVCLSVSKTSTVVSSI